MSVIRAIAWHRQELSQSKQICLLHESSRSRGLNDSLDLNNSRVCPGENERLFNTISDYTRLISGNSLGKVLRTVSYLIVGADNPQANFNDLGKKNRCQYTVPLTWIKQHEVAYNYLKTEQQESHNCSPMISGHSNRLVMFFLCFSRRRYVTKKVNSRLRTRERAGTGTLFPTIRI